jgi:hypothetical protein
MAAAAPTTRMSQSIKPFEIQLEERARDDASFRDAAAKIKVYVSDKAPLFAFFEARAALMAYVDSKLPGAAGRDWSREHSDDARLAHASYHHAAGTFLIDTKQSKSANLERELKALGETLQAALALAGGEAAAKPKPLAPLPEFSALDRLRGLSLATRPPGRARFMLSDQTPTTAQHLPVPPARARASSAGSRYTAADDGVLETLNIPAKERGRTRLPVPISDERIRAHSAGRTVNRDESKGT